MADITASMVKELREKTDAGMMDCKAALNETGGDMEAAIDLLRKKGLAKAPRRLSRGGRRPRGHRFCRPEGRRGRAQFRD